MDMIVLVEDDPSIRKLVAYALEMNGYSVKVFESGEQAFSEDLGDVQLFILDIMLPGMSGLDILAKLKADQKYSTVPVVILTAKDTEYDIVTGLDAGADDYIAKPFGIMELISRIKAILRRFSSSSQSAELTSGELIAGELKLSEAHHRVTVSGREIGLTFKEFQLLSYLMANPGIALDRNRIMEDVWNYSTDSDTRTIDVHVRHLREKLGNEGERIETIKGLGYRFIQS